MDPENSNPLTNISLYVGLVVVLIFALGIYGVFKLYQKKVVSPAIAPTPAPQSFESLVSPSPSTTPKQAANPPQTLPEAGSETQEVKNVGIALNAPKENQIVKTSLFVSGTANVTSQIVQIKVKDSIGEILGQGQATACLSVNGCPFEVWVNLTKPITQTGTVEVYSRNTVSGQAEYLQIIPVIFSN